MIHDTNFHRVSVPGTYTGGESDHSAARFSEVLPRARSVAPGHLRGPGLSGQPKPQCRARAFSDIALALAGTAAWLGIFWAAWCMVPA